MPITRHANTAEAMSTVDEPLCRVFVSYSRVDATFASRLVSALLDRGYEAYMDQRDILPGEPWQERLGKLIEGADVVAFALSPDSVASTMCDWEINEAERLGKKVLPVVCRNVEVDTVPQRLKRLNYVFLRSDDEWAAQFDALARSLIIDIEWVREHTRIGATAIRWAEAAQQSPSKAEALLLRGPELSEAENWISRQPANGPEVTTAQRSFVRASRNAEQLSMRRALRRSRITSVASLIATFVVTTLAWFFYDQWREAQIAKSRFLADQSNQLSGPAIRDGVTGVLLALEALPDRNSGNVIAQLRPYVPAAELALHSALHARHEMNVFNHRSEAVQSAAFSPDGSRILTTTSAGIGRIWGADAKGRVETLGQSAGERSGAVFNPDGTRLLTWSGGASASLLKTTSTLPIATLSGHTAPILAAIFGPSGRIVTMSDDKTARVWNAEGKLIFVTDLHRDVITHAAFSSDGRRLATGSRDNTVRVWSAETGAILVTFSGHRGVIEHVDFSPDGRLVVSASRDGTAKIWDSRSARLIATLSGHTDIVRSSRFSEDGNSILTSSDDGTARIWNSGNGEPRITLSGHAGPITKSIFSADGKQVITASRDRRAYIWESQSGVKLATLAGHDAAIIDVSFSADGASVLTASEDGTARRWSVSGTARSFPLAGEITHEAVYSPDGDRFVTSGRVPRLWDASNGRVIAEMTSHDGNVGTIRFSLDGQRIVTGGQDGTARIWSAETAKLIATSRGHTAEVIRAVFTPDGRRIITGSADKSSRIWDAATGAEIGSLNGHGAEIWDVAVSPDGRQIATASGDGRIGLWNSSTGQPERTLRNIGGAGNNTVRYSQDGRLLVTTSHDNLIRVWQPSSGALVAEMSGHSDVIVGVCLFDDSKRIASTGWDRSLRIWDVKSAKPTAHIQAHSHRIDSIDCSPDGKRIMTAAHDGKIKIWDADTGLLIGEHQSERSFPKLARFSNDGRSILSLFRDAAKADYNTIKIWPSFSTTRELVEYAKSSVPRCLTSQQRDQFFLAKSSPSWCQQ
jgi:WD40 repeat protein